MKKYIEVEMTAEEIAAYDKEHPWRLVADDFPLDKEWGCGCKRHRRGRCECGRMAYLTNFDGSPH